MLDVAKCCCQFKEILDEGNFQYTNISSESIAISFSYKRMNKVTGLVIFKDPGYEGRFLMYTMILLISSDDILRKYDRSKIIKLCNTIPRNKFETQYIKNKTISVMEVKVDSIGLISEGEMIGLNDVYFKEKCLDFFIKSLDYANDIYPKFLV